MADPSFGSEGEVEKLGIGVPRSPQLPTGSGPAVNRVQDGPLKELVITDSIAVSHEAETCPKIRKVSVAPLIGEAIRRIANEESVSKLFD